MGLGDGVEYDRGTHSHYFAYLSPSCLSPYVFVLFSTVTAKSVTDVDELTENRQKRTVISRLKMKSQSEVKLVVAELLC